MLQLDAVCKSYGVAGGHSAEPVSVLDDISLQAKPGEFLTIIGPSGCGKSTLLSCIAGLVPYDSGDIIVNGERVHGPFTQCAVVFQQASLLPWRNVMRNVEYGLELAGVDKGRRRARAVEALTLVGLEQQQTYLPHELSGGMQQRVNLARALAMEPDLLLMDEPFGAVDALTKEHLQDELVTLTTRRSRTTVFITHDVEEAVFLGDRVIVMSSRPGRIKEILGVPLRRPRSRTDLAAADMQQLIMRLRAMLGTAPEGIDEPTAQEATAGRR
jgi:NitT/TauT family transport system ATP-binding protein